MLIVIEGVDRVGKSTLARRIAKLTGAEVRHAGPPTRGCIEEYETSLNGFSPYSRLVLDRWHVGEHVWPKIFERETDMDEARARHVEMFMESRGALTIYATRDEEKLKKELVEHNEPLTPEKLPEAEKLFTHARVWAGCWAATWDYELTTDDELDEILRLARQRAYLAQSVYVTVGPNVVGSLSPDTLYVGDEQGPKKEGRDEPLQVPFAPFPATSGYYLMQALTNWRSSMIVNARDRDRGVHYRVKSLWKKLGKPEVVALGRNAHECLIKDEVPHRSIPHPQYWRRFKHGEIEEYSKLLRGDIEWDW